jgi:TonB family protein
MAPYPVFVGRNMKRRALVAVLVWLVSAAASRGAERGGCPVAGIQPWPVEVVAPAYPDAARAARVVSRDVRVCLEIGDDGTPTGAKAHGGPGLLEEAARKAALRWRFAPVAAREGYSHHYEVLFIFDVVAASDAAGEPRTVFRLPNEIEVRASVPSPATIR